MLENDWQGGRQEKDRLYWKVREERKRVVREKYELWFAKTSYDLMYDLISFC